VHVLVVQASVKIQTCVGADKKAIDCLQGGGSQCYCLRTSRSAKQCLGVCWDQIESLLCSAEGRASEENTRLARVAEEKVKRAKRAEEAAEWMPDDDETVDEPPVHEPHHHDPHHHMHPAFDGTCDEATATLRTTDCVSHDEDIKVPTLASDSRRCLQHRALCTALTHTNRSRVFFVWRTRNQLLSFELLCASLSLEPFSDPRCRPASRETLDTARACALVTRYTVLPSAGRWWKKPCAMRRTQKTGSTPTGTT
jgi:hypothetical protein